MNSFLKSLFISVFPVFALYVLILSAYHLAQPTTAYLQLLGSLGIALVVFSFFLGLFLRPTARTDKHLNLQTGLILIGYVVVLIGRFTEDRSYMVYYSSTFLVFGWIVYLTWFSSFKSRTSTRLAVGEKLPEFTLTNSEKETIASKSFLGKPSIWLFYRGNWCPLCMAQIKEIAQEYKALEDRGAQTILISPQPHKLTKGLTRKYNLGFHFLRDDDNRVAKQLGILHKNGIPAGFQTLGYDSDTAMPTVVITDALGKIVFVDLTDNYRVRPEPSTFLEVLDGLGS